MVIGLSVSGSARATLFDRGSGLIYDSDQDITWLQNANLAGSELTWEGAVGWADGLMFGGFSDWRLPITVQPDITCSNQTPFTGFPNQGYGTGCTGSEMGHLFNVDSISQAGPGPFTSVQPSYWSGTEIAPNPLNAWVFLFFLGLQLPFEKEGFISAWAVRPGDVLAAPIPEPPTADPNGPYSALPGVPITLDGTGSFDPDGDIIEYLWQIASLGSPVFGPTPTVTFPFAGTFDINLVITNSFGLQDQASTFATVVPEPSTLLLLASGLAGLAAWRRRKAA